ncbi:trypsin-like peptidase domain-containing protein [Micromonospora sp. NPDC051006]|uniref:trypsin-like peptidase domain-containing protein n=1 Tax=Micromonospora sp. NPDC051006 TaxID=3364283 RepID=UPI0037AF3BCC
MTEYESDPQQHRPAPTDAEPAHPTAELPRVERAQSDSASSDPTTELASAGPVAGNADQTPATGAGASATPEPTRADAPATPDTDRDADPTVPVATTPAGYPAAPTGGWQPPATTPTHSGHPVSGQPVSGPHGQPVSGPHGQPVSGPHGQPVSGPHGYPQPAGGHWYPTQQSGWASGGQPGAYGQSHAPHPGQPVPPWAPAAHANPAGPRPSRVAKFAGAGVAMFALMLGSGVAGGALALAIDGDGGGITRTYSAAPVINGADLPRIAASVQDSVVSIATDNGEGSGVILSADGYVLTNNHVVASASGDTVRVVFADGKTAEAQIKGTDPKTDLAVVKANGVSGLKPATFGDSDAMQVGDQVLALGSPLGLQGSVTAGILSARERTIQAGEGGQQQQDPRQAASSIAGLLQTDAPINPGNSGGALVNTRGEVIGINTAIATSGQSTGNIGVGFAIPSNKAKDVAGKLQRGEKVSHPSLGVSVNMAEGGGALVAAVTQGSPAEKAGLQRGDVITRFGDKVINDSDDLVGAVQAGKVGDRVEVQYKRNGAESTATVTLAETS